MGNFQTLPALRNYARDLTTQAVKMFKGLNIYTPLTNASPEWAVDLLNVIVNNSGSLSKFRFPSPLVTTAFGSGPQRFYDFQQASGIRQIIAQSSTGFAVYNALMSYIQVFSESSLLDVAVFDLVTSNNLGFIANGQRMSKWTGTAIQNWGIQQPKNATIGATIALLSLTRTGGNTVATFPAPAGLFTTVGSTIALITISGVPDNTFNGSFSGTGLSVVGGLVSVSYVNAGGDTTFVNQGQIQIHYVSALYTNFINQVSRRLGVSTLRLTTDTNVQPGDQFIVSGLATASFNGTFTVLSVVHGATPSITYKQDLIDVVATGDTGTIAQGNAGGEILLYRAAFANSVTGHVGTASNITVPLNGSYAANQSYFVQIDPPNPADPQIDTIWWFRTLGGGSDFYLHSITKVADGFILFDRKSDAELNKSIQAQLINDPPLPGLYLKLFQNRIFIFNLVGASQDVIYSGLERIFIGRPEESFPVFNRLRLAIGADDIRAGGVIQAGVIAFSRSNQMYMFRGVVEDIVTNAPLLFSSYLEELPWKVGSISHYAGDTSPYGYVWWASDRTVQIFDGTQKPVVISTAVTALLRKATRGQESNARGKYFNWMDREWYVLTFAFGGSLVNNRIIFFDLNPNPELNFGAFLSDLEADDIQVVEDPISGQRKLCISNSGIIYDILAEGDVQSGISLTPIPQTSNNLNAFWESGLFGNETPQTRKMMRFGQIIADAGGFNVLVKVIDDRGNPITNPLIIQPPIDRYGMFSINRKCKRMGIRIQFPVQDLSCNVLELTNSYRDSGDKQ